MLSKLNLPEFDHKLKKAAEKLYIFDLIRKKWIILSPEEWIRQNLSQYLIQVKKYSVQRIAHEMTLNIKDYSKRCDIVAFNKELRPYLIIECKAPEISINQKVFDQVFTYNFRLNASYLAVSNGLVHHCLKMNYEEKTYTLLNQFPDPD